MALLYETQKNNTRAYDFQSYPNASPVINSPTNFNGMDPSTWTQQILPHRYAWFHVSWTAATMDENTLQSTGKTINDIVNQVAATVLQQAPTLIVNAGLQEGVNLSVIGLAVDAGYSTEIQYLTLPLYHAPVPVTVYKLWYALYLVYDTTNDLPVASIPTGSLDTTLTTQYQLITIIAIVVAGIVLGILGAIALIELGNWLKSMTTTTDTTTSTNTITNPSNQSVTVQTPNGTVTIPPGGSYTWKDTSTSTTPNLEGIITVGAVAIGLVGVGAFSYFLLKGAKAPKK
jgi:hypothetical protein